MHPPSPACCASSVSGPPCAGGNSFKGKAYARAADNLLTLSQSLDDLIAQDRLREIPGVGEAIGDIVKRLHATGTHSGLERMREGMPEGVLDLLTVRASTCSRPISMPAAADGGSSVELAKRTKCSGGRVPTRIC
jgi:hypothetical protein